MTDRLQIALITLTELLENWLNIYTVDHDTEHAGSSPRLIIGNPSILSDRCDDVFEFFFLAEACRDIEI